YREAAQAALAKTARPRATYALGPAARRGDAAMVRRLAEAGAPLIESVSWVARLGDTPAGVPRGYLAPDVEVPDWPDSPGAAELKAMDLLAAEVVRAHGPQALEKAFASAAYSGYGEVMERLVARGFDPSRAKDPWRIWSNWAGQSCKPSIARLLARTGLPASYPPNDRTRRPALHTVVASCRNPESVTVLVGGGLDVNLISVDGQTALDVARATNRPKLVAALQALGGRTAVEVDPAAVARYRAERDLDVVQSEEL
ncbi:hypothetical protein, partial [Caulobacter sp. 17J65-9]|uniref:hypothetical protein n=1 Tax=Caulobacter sp. 17J65-9 TaxID=2709382 RepID=UPI0013C90751